MEVKRAFLSDADDLLAAWEEASSTSFTTFKALWHDRAMSFIHEGRPKDFERREFLQTLYTTGCDVLRDPASSLPLKIGALYMMYLLFETQPGSYKQRVRMYMSPEDLKAFHALVREACQHRLVEAATVANRLMTSGALLYGAVHSRLDADTLSGPAAVVRKMRVRLLPPGMLEKHFDKPVANFLPLSQVDHDAREYNEARKRLVAANQGPHTETEDSPYITLAEDLLKVSTALDRQVRTVLQESTAGQPSAKRTTRRATNVSNGAGAREAEPVETVADVIDEPPPPLPVQSMPSIPGLFGSPSELMDVEPPDPSLANDGSEIDPGELARELDALETDDMEQDKHESTAREPSFAAERFPEHDSAEGPGSPVTGEPNGGADGVLGNGNWGPANGGIRLNGEGEGLLGSQMERHGVENGHAVLDRRRAHSFSQDEEESDSDEDVDVRRPLPRAHSPLL